MTSQRHANRQAEPKKVSLAEMVAEPGEAAAGEAFSQGTWIRIAALGGLLAAVYYWQFPRLVAMWMHEANWSHGFLIPLFSLYLLYARRDEIRAATRRTCLWGLPILIGGLLWQILAYYPVNVHWLIDLSMTVTLFGLVLYLAGPGIAKLTWLPIFFLGFAMPWPKRLYTAIALPLQQFAAFVSMLVLKLFGVEIDVTSSTLTIVSRSGKIMPLTVAEACSGVRSLIAFVAIGVAIAYLENRPTWQRVVLVFATVPIAILCNVIRVTVTCTMYAIDKPEMGQDFMHDFLGLVMLIPAFLMLWALGWGMRKLFTEEDEEEEPDGQLTPGGESETSA